MRYYRHYAQCSYFLDIAQLLTQMLLDQVYVAHRLKSSLQIIRLSSQSGWPLQNFHILNNNGSFTFYAKCVLSSIIAKTFTGLDCIYEFHRGCLTRSRNCLSFARTWFHPCLVLLGPYCSSLYFCVILLFTLWLPCCDLRYDDLQKRWYLHLYLELFVGGAHVLFTLFVFSCS